MTCRPTTPATTYFVRGSGPQSLVTYIGWEFPCQPSACVGLEGGASNGADESGLVCRLASCHTSGCALMMARRRVRWGSSVYVQKKSRSLSSISASSCSFVDFGAPFALALTSDGRVAVEEATMAR